MGRKRNKSSSVVVYNRILREFTKINNLLPENRKLSLKDRRKLISEKIFPNYKGISPSRIRIKQVKNSLFTELNKIPPNELCDVNYIHPSILPNIDVFGIDEYIQTVLPNCIFIKVSAGQFGETRIFNTRNYNYQRNGVRAIIENIRSAMENGELPSTMDFMGYKKLRDGKPNDGTPEYYYIDFVLVIGNEPQADTTVTEFEIPKNRENKKTETKYQNVILQRIKGLIAKKRRKKRATKSYNKNITELKKIRKRIRQSKKPETKQVLTIHLAEKFDKLYEKIDKDLKKELITPEQHKIRINNAYDAFLLAQGGIINKK